MGGRNPAPGETLDEICYLCRPEQGGIDLKDMVGGMPLEGLDEADVQGLGFGVFPALLLPVAPLPQPGEEEVRPAAEDHDEVAGEEMGQVPLDESLAGSELPGPALLVDDRRIPLRVPADGIVPDRIGEMNHGISPAGELLRRRRFSGAGSPGDPAHHGRLISVMNRSFSQSSPTLTRM